MHQDFEHPFDCSRDISISLLVKLRDTYIDKIKNKDLDGSEKCSYRSDFLSSLAEEYLGERFLYIPVHGISKNNTIQEFVDYLNDVILNFIHEENKEIMYYDEQDGLYKLFYEYDSDEHSLKKKAK